MSDEEKQAAWKRTLESMPRREAGGREAVEPTASSVVQQFLRDVHHRFEAAASAFRLARLEATIEPSTAQEISADSSIELQVTLGGVPGTAHSLRCERARALEMHLLLDREHPWQEWCSFAIDREPEPPTIFVEDFLEKLDAKTKSRRPR